MHGKVSTDVKLRFRIFKGIPKKFYATRYHSLVIQNNTLPNNFKIISDTIDNGKKVIMGIEHNQYPCFGYNFIQKV